MGKVYKIEKILRRALLILESEDGLRSVLTNLETGILLCKGNPPDYENYRKRMK